MTYDVHESDQPGAATVLLSAGLGGTAGYWAPQLAALRARYRVVAYDQAGTGRKRSLELPAGHSIAAMADEALGILDATGTASCHFVGHALGGAREIQMPRRMERQRQPRLRQGAVDDVEMRVVQRAAVHRIGAGESCA